MFNIALLIAYAQATSGEMAGVVRDPAGLGLGGAWVVIEHGGTGYRVRLETDEAGRYRLLAAPPGQYRVEVERAPFAPLRRSGVELRAGEHLNLDLEMSLGEAGQRVEVSGAPPVLESTRGTVSFHLEGRQAVSLPLDGRNFVPLLALSPGVNLAPGSVLPRINGSRPRASEYLYDGVSVLQPEPGQVAYSPVVDAIAELRVETNSVAAEFGRSNGGIILVNQKAGDGQWRGSLFEFLRHEGLNARNFFAAPGGRPRFRRNQYGGVLGGPVERNRSFVFGDFQGTRLSQGVVRLSTVPTAGERGGIFRQPVYDAATTRRDGTGWARDVFAGNQIPAARWNPVVRGLVSRYPEANLGGTANNYRRLGREETRAEQWGLRVDRYVGARQRWFGRYTYLRDRGVPATPLADGSGSVTAGILGDTRTRADGVASEYTATISPVLVNQLRLGWTGRRLERVAMRSGAGLESVLPTYEVVGFQQLGPAAGANAEMGTAVLQVADQLSRVRGAHTIKVGVDLRWQRLDVLQPGSPAGNYQFTTLFTSGLTGSGAAVANTGSSFASFLTGQVTRYTIDRQAGKLGPRAANAEFFAQDDWRVGRSLSVNYGVRYTLNFPSTVVGDRGAVFNLKTEKLDFLGVEGFPRAARNLEKANIAPRVGLAWRMGDKAVARAGYGLMWIEQTGITTPFTTPLFPFIQTQTRQTLDNLEPALVLGAGAEPRAGERNRDSGLGQGVFAVQRDNGSGYAQQWNMSVQRAIGASGSVEVGYLGSKLTRLGVPDVNLNQLTVEQLREGARLLEGVGNPYPEAFGGEVIARAQLLRPYPRFGTVALYRNNVGHSTYHSLQVRGEKRFGRGLAFTVAYTWSKLIDDAGAVFDAAVLSGPVVNFQAADSFNKRLEKDVSTGDVPRQVSAGFVYELPFGRGRWRGGWSVAGVARRQAGSPVAVVQATNLNAFAGFGTQRPNRVGQPELSGGEKSPQRWFDRGAFAAAGQFTLGNSSRNPVRGPGFGTLDVVVSKTIPLREGLRMELRGEAFNATNRANLGSPNGSFGTAAFGVIGTAFDPRVFELVGKIHF
ncbi:MAG: carboxypeptidase-like regulatory domain-containing protein [Bryobacter sp.]|nr:carboxypeptidase-like regulatory domain-containing protein [Bryobacter sp. CoA8 C33]